MRDDMLVPPRAGPARGERRRDGHAEGPRQPVLSTHMQLNLTSCQGSTLVCSLCDAFEPFSLCDCRVQLPVQT